MLLCNFEVRINATGKLTDEAAEILTKQASETFYRLIAVLEQDARIRVSVTEV